MKPPPRSRGLGIYHRHGFDHHYYFVVGAGLKVMKVLDRADDAISGAEASAPSSVVAVGTATPKPTSCAHPETDPVGNTKAYPHSCFITLGYSARKS